MSEKNKQITSNRSKTVLLAQLGILIAIEAIIALTPLGSLPIGPIVATLGHIPVIIAAIVLGTGAGTFMGFVFGLLSFLVWTFMTPNALIAFVWTPAYAVPGTESGSVLSLLICFVPRIILGLSMGLLTKLLLKIDKKGYVAYPLAAVICTLLHTVLVLGGIYIFFGEPYAAAFGMEYSALFAGLLSVVATNGVVEAILAAVVAVAFAKVIPVIKKSIKRA